MKPKNLNRKASSGLKGKNKVKSKSADLSTMSVSDFMNSFESVDDEDEKASDDSVPEMNGNSRDSEESSTEDQEVVDDNDDSEKEDITVDEDSENEEMADDEDEGEEEEEDDEDDEEEEEEEEEEDSENDEMDVEEKVNQDSGEESDTFDSQTHKKSLEKLRKTDPEFYKFLEENDRKLLQFNVSDSEDDDEDEKTEEEKVHKPVEDLEVASDESDFEVEGREVDDRVVTLKMVQSTQEQLQNTTGLELPRKAIQMFHSALQRVAAPKAAAADDNDNDGPQSAIYVVDSSAVFNAVVQMCVLDLQPALKRCLKLPAGKSHTPINKCKRWNKVKNILKLYLADLVKFLGSVSSPHIQVVLLKHLHQLALFIPYFVKIKKPLLKKLVQLWGSGEETVRVVAFLCILKITTNEQQELLEQVLKMMYLAYVSNSKFVSPSTFPSIQFMRRSLAEMFALNETVSYQYVFLYVRQLAIHLRNAITLHSKESIQSVYNWQFIQSLHLWTEVLGATAHRPQLQPLLYPLVQVIIGTLKLIPTVQYYPLRFHSVQMLIHLSKQTGTFIPVLPFLLEVLANFKINKQNKKVSMKPLDFTCILRLSKSQQQENGFKDAVIEKVYQQLLEYLASESHTISFPDMVVPTVIQLKKFVKECKSPNYSRKIKQVLDKIEENSKVVETERRKVSFALTDQKAIDAWETNLRLKGTPLMTFYESWSKVNIRQKAKRATANDEIGEFNLPMIKRRVKKSENQDKDEGPVELFPSDESDDEVGGELSSSPKKRKRGIRGGKGKAKARESFAVGIDNVTENEDIVKDLRLSDLED